jgi:hypothetical protein
MSLRTPPKLKSLQATLYHKAKHDLRGWLTRTNPHPLDEIVAPLNRKLFGWANYFRYGSVRRVRQNLDEFVYQRLRGFLRRRYSLVIFLGG